MEIWADHKVRFKLSKIKKSIVIAATFRNLTAKRSFLEKYGALKICNDPFVRRMTLWRKNFMKP